MPTESRAPRLLPQNRKLRHLQGIYLRNLSFQRPRGRTTDDVAIHASPKKTDTLRETPKLHHALSSEDLRPKMRRRSTTLTQDSPVSEQKKLEALYNSRMADAFFSMHVDGEDDPIYISETLERKTNFNFLFFDLSKHGSSVMRSPLVTIKIWAKRYVGSKEWFLHQEDVVDLRSLNFLGTLLNQRFPLNGLIFHLEDGVYSLDLPARKSKPKATATLPTSSYNALMKLATLDSSIQDALSTQEHITTQINELLSKQPRNDAPLAEERVKLAQKYVSQQAKSVKSAEKRRDELKASLKARREAIAAGREAQAKAERDIVAAREPLESSKSMLAQTQEQIRGQRRRICSDLSNIFPITPCPSGEPLSFQICGLPLQNTSYDSPSSKNPNEDVMSAAFGHVAMLTHNLQYYLRHPLPYDINPFGSRSTIRDDISAFQDTPASRHTHGASSSLENNPAREFPLYLPRGGSTAAHFRFDYAWFLLNKDIEALCAHQSLRVVDIRHSLPNLKYLLYVCSAGTEDVPERKRGGVRGLWAGHLKGRITTGDGEADGSVTGSRPSSADGQAAESLRRASEDLGIGFDDGHMKVSLRTKGFRENVGK
ncbi:UV radiation resistance-associated protein like [Verticillium longisporum]|uniref:UV radiation resistance-associated protein like n=1 Tax=Verticillium longisporum TaxID=100787 RepID=A0A0G4MI22_VERLO|nr:UV radiation resistance-associated protein like [Verticillium longisporum]KAG7136045.1 UV radiation resistance-associated protein like [Verticillium longisporum]CRK33923.1 hypothetical protein BN1708_006192 [Verticillium longisporum]